MTKVRVITGMGTWEMDAANESYDEFRLRANFESQQQVVLRASIFNYKVLLNTRKCLHIKQWLPIEYKNVEGYSQNNFSWMIRKTCSNYVTDITENKDERDGKEYPAIIRTIDRTLYEYEAYMYPFIRYAFQNDIDIKLKGFKDSVLFRRTQQTNKPNLFTYNPIKIAGF